MQIVQFKIEESYIDMVLSHLKSFNKGVVKDLLVKKDKNPIESSVAQEFLELGGSQCWDGDLEEMRQDRISYGTGR